MTPELLSNTIISKSRDFTTRPALSDFMTRPPGLTSTPTYSTGIVFTSGDSICSNRPMFDSLLPPSSKTKAMRSIFGLDLRLIIRQGACLIPPYIHFVQLGGWNYAKPIKVTGSSFLVLSGFSPSLDMQIPNILKTRVIHVKPDLADE